jgi:hypothetical protein
MGVGEMLQMHGTSSNSGWAHTGTSSGTTATGRAPLDHSDRYQKLKFRLIPRYGGGRRVAIDYGKVRRVPLAKLV